MREGNISARQLERLPTEKQHLVGVRLLINILGSCVSAKQWQVGFPRSKNFLFSLRQSLSLQTEERKHSWHSLKLG